MQNNLFFSITRFWKYLSKKRRFQLLALFILLLISGALEMLSLAAFVPFLTILTAPETLLNIGFLKILNIPEDIFKSYNLIFFFTLFLSVLVLISGIVRSICLWLNVKISAFIGEELSTEAYKKSLFIPYEELIKGKTSSKIVTNITFTNLLVDSIYSFFTVMSSFIIAVGIILGLLSIGFVYVLCISLFVFIYYSIIISKFKNSVKRQSVYSAESNKSLVKLMQETYGSIENIILEQSQYFFVRIFRKLISKYHLSAAKVRFSALFPKLIVETICLLGATVFVLITYNSNSIYNYITILGTIALAIQKLIPTVQQLYTNYVVLLTNNYGVNHVLDLLELKQIKNNKRFLFDKEKSFLKSISLRNLSYRYSQDSPYIFKKVNIDINRGEKIGILGKSGTGKSTFIKVMMTLIAPTKGDIYLDNKSLFSDKGINNKFNWRASLAYVPQNVYLMDISFAENIAFGVKYEDIDFVLLDKVCKQADLYDFIKQSRYGYKTKAGERGQLISGGQRQRFGIARALYRKPSVIFFDESTSSLDSETEAKVLNSIYSLGKNINIFIISHKKSTLYDCNRLFILKDGNFEIINK